MVGRVFTHSLLVASVRPFFRVCDPSVLFWSGLVCYVCVGFELDSVWCALWVSVCGVLWRCVSSSVVLCLCVAVSVFVVLIVV